MSEDILYLIALAAKPETVGFAFLLGGECILGQELKDTAGPKPGRGMYSTEEGCVVLQVLRLFAATSDGS